MVSKPGKMKGCGILKTSQMTTGGSIRPTRNAVTGFDRTTGCVGQFDLGLKGPARFGREQSFAEQPILYLILLESLIDVSGNFFCPSSDRFDAAGLRIADRLRDHVARRIASL